MLSHLCTLVRFDLNKFHQKANVIFDRENLINFKHKVVAFALDAKGHILTSGWNSYTKSHPTQKKAAMSHSEGYKCFMHAEVRALTRLSYKQMEQVESLVVIRLDSEKSLMPGKPCKICSDVIRDYKIKNVLHS